jgi:imidazolonepropionase
MRKTIVNISKILHIAQHGELSKRGNALQNFPITTNAWMLVEDGKIQDYGAMQDGLPEHPGACIDAAGGMLLPCWVDSHTHLVYAKTREDEFAQRLAGMSYEEIAARGGGILNSVAKLRKASAAELFDAAKSRLNELIKMGTGAIEIKSGYGLDTASEIKMLEVAQMLSEAFPIPIKKTFLGAHAIPSEFHGKSDAYVDHILSEMLPAIAEKKLADYVDVFCEKGYFNVDQTVRIIKASTDFNMKAKLHVNQFNILGIIEKAIEYDALSVDHLEVLSAHEAALLGSSNTIATLLPGCSLFLEIPFAPARQLIDQDALVALATDFNPGSAPSGNMNLAVALACIKMKMTPEEAITAATLNGAAAIELSHEVGSIERGKRANFMLTHPMENPSFIPYNFGHQHLAAVYLNGSLYAGS